MKTLCVYTTRTGISKEIAEKVASFLGAELLEITDGKTYKGFFGYIKAAIEGLKKSLPQLMPYKAGSDISEYDEVIVVSPIWCEKVCPIARAFINENKDSIKSLFLIIDHMSGIEYDKAVNAVLSENGKEPGKYLSLQTSKFDYMSALCDHLNEYKEKKI